jgi:two-component system sensor histidine kinase DesK
VTEKTQRPRFPLLPPDRELGWTPYAWLVYSVPFVVAPFWFPVPWHALALTVASWLLFLALYFRGYWVSGGRLLPVMAGLVALGVLWIPRNPMANCFFIYAAAFAGGVGPPRVAARYLFGTVAIVLAQAWLMQLPPYAWMPAALVSLLVGGPNIHFAETSRQNEKLRLAQQEVEHLAKVAERERIARDMHDLLGHTLSLVVLKSELAAKLVGRDPARAEREIREVEAVSRQALAEVRSAIVGYRTRGLQAELQSVRPTLEAAGIELFAELPSLTLPAAAEGVLALALREAVTNVARHSGAQHCWVGLTADERSVSLEVRDDGRGGEASFGSGLTGMRERARALGGEVVRDAGAGTRLLVSLPLPTATAP